MPDPDNFTYQVKVDNTKELEAALAKLANTKVMVGIPSDDEPSKRSGSETRPGSSIGNAALGYIHEHGSPINNIPPRPWLSPGVSSSKNTWIPYLQQAAQHALDGRLSSVDRALNACGLAVVAAIKNRVTAGIPPPLSPRTISARRRRSKGSKYRRQAVSQTDVTPLVDTGAFLSSITYVIRKLKR